MANKKKVQIIKDAIRDKLVASTFGDGIIIPKTIKTPPPTTKAPTKVGKVTVIGS